MRRLAECCLSVVATIILVPAVALGAPPPPTTQNVAVTNTPSVNVVNTPNVNVPSGVTVNNTTVDPVPVTGSVTVSNLPAANWPVEVANTPNVNVANQPTVHVTGTVPVTGSVALTGTPNVNVPDGVTVNNSTSMPVPVAVKEPARFLFNTEITQWPGRGVGSVTFHTSRAGIIEQVSVDCAQGVSFEPATVVWLLVPIAAYPDGITSVTAPNTSVNGVFFTMPSNSSAYHASHTIQVLLPFSNPGSIEVRAIGSDGPTSMLFSCVVSLLGHFTE